MIKLEENSLHQHISTREKRITFFIQNYGGCGSSEMAKKLDLALPTVKKKKKTVQELVANDMITKEGQGKSTVYFAL